MAAGHPRELAFGRVPVLRRKHDAPKLWRGLCQLWLLRMGAPFRCCLSALSGCDDSMSALARGSATSGISARHSRLAMIYLLLKSGTRQWNQGTTGTPRKFLLKRRRSVWPQSCVQMIPFRQGADSSELPLCAALVNSSRVPYSFLLLNLGPNSPPFHNV